MRVPGNRLADDGTYHYTYDAEGNLIRRVKDSNGDRLDLTYDYRNRLVEIVESFGDPNDPVLDLAYRYDIFDRLVWRAETDYHHSGGGEGGSLATVTTTVDVERRFYDGDHVVLAKPPGTVPILRCPGSKMGLSPSPRGFDICCCTNGPAASS